MWRYRRFMTSVPIQAINLSGEYMHIENQWKLVFPDLKDVFDSIQEDYTRELGQIYTEQILHHFFQHLAPLILEILGPLRSPPVDQDIFFLSDPKRYRDPNRLTIFELNYTPHNKGTGYETKEVDLYAANCGLMSPLLDNHKLNI